MICATSERAKETVSFQKAATTTEVASARAEQPREGLLGKAVEVASTYSLRQVEALLGWHESAGRTGLRHVTVLDLLSWARDPGGGQVWSQLSMQAQQADAWMAKRGPLAPDGQLACILYDFLRAMKRLSLVEQAIVGLTAIGFSPDEIAQVMDGDELDARADWRETDARRRKISRYLEGRPRRDREGNVLKDEDGRVLYTGGVARRLLAFMNGTRT